MLRVHSSKGLRLICLISIYWTLRGWAPLPECQYPGRRLGVSIDQRASSGGLIHHSVCHCQKGDLCVLSMKDGVNEGRPPPPDDATAGLTRVPPSCRTGPPVLSKGGTERRPQVGIIKLLSKHLSLIRAAVISGSGGAEALNLSPARLCAR